MNTGKKGTSAIQKLTLGGRRDVQFPGKHSVGVFDVVEPVPKRLRDEANEHVLKVVDISDKSASCEPYALEQFGVWHRTGIRHGQLPNGTEVKFGGIYLRTEPGKDIRADEKWDKASSEQRLAYLKEVQREVRGIVYDHAFGSKERPNTNKAKLVPCDFGPGNVLLETDVREETEEGKTEVVIFPLKTTLIDFGKTGLKRSSKKPAKSDFKAWFNRRFKLLWGYQYVQAGDPKSVYNEFAKWYIEEWQKPVQRLAIEAGPSGEAGGETGEADSKQKKQKKKKRDPKGKGKRQ
ncbi:hypothetical protein EV361DRAFT_416575 [Lentinula raphanica]|nr:hypothetical protein EV361DRAFT_416575 [Lentinula raphanica]